MSILEAFKLALQSLWGNKMRSILTLIGVVMGVASVIMVLTLVQGAKRFISTKLSGYGADVFTVNRMSSVILTADEYFSYQKRKIIRMEDYEAIKDGCDDLQRSGRFAVQEHQSGLQRPLQQQHGHPRLHGLDDVAEQHRHRHWTRLYSG